MASKRVGWLSTVARTGFKELPSNAVWVLSKAFEPTNPAASGAAASSASVTVGAAGMKLKGGASKVMDSLVDNLPVVGNESVESFMRWADESSEVGGPPYQPFDRSRKDLWGKAALRTRGRLVGDLFNPLARFSRARYVRLREQPSKGERDARSCELLRCFG